MTIKGTSNIHFISQSLKASAMSGAFLYSSDIMHSGVKHKTSKKLK
jgi:hypothetical protein